MIIEYKNLKQKYPEVELEMISETEDVYRFTSGEYEGITYTYVDVDFEDVGTEEEPMLNILFKYNLLENKNNIEFDKEEFKLRISQILVTIVDEVLMSDD